MRHSEALAEESLSSLVRDLSLTLKMTSNLLAVGQTMPDELAMPDKICNY